MNIEHCMRLSWFHERTDAETKRPCARLPDVDRESFAASASGDPAMVLMFRMASTLPMVRASCPLHPAAGLRLDVIAHDRLRKPEATFRDHASARTLQGPRAKTRARSARNCTQRRMLCFSSRAL